MHGNRRPIPLYLFAKAPVAGQVKTRMHPFLSPERSAQLALMMLTQTVKKVCRHWPGQTILTVTPHSDHVEFKKLHRKYSFDFEIQVEGNLGERMLHVLDKGIALSGAAVVMGCDVPYFESALLKEVHGALRADLNVVGPAEDGGFYLLGLTECQQALFQGVKWGEGNVLPSVKHSAALADIQFVECRMLRDIDTWADLRWLSGQEPAYRAFLVDAG